MADQYIEIKGPFQLRSREAGDKVVKEAMRLAKEHPKAKFILRESAKKQGFGSVYSSVFKAFTRNKMGDRLKVVKANYEKQFSHLGPPSEVREAKILSLKPFKTAEFTFSGEVPSAEYKRWQEVDIGLSEEKHWDPLKSKGQHFQSFKGYNKDAYLVQKYPGGGSGATKKVDAFLDRLSEYGRKEGAKQTSIDAGIQYIRDKNDEFVETQRYSKDPKYKNKQPIHMLSKDRLKRLDRLQKNYGTPPKQTGKVNLVETEKKPVITEGSAKTTLSIEALKRWKGRVQDGKINLPEHNKGQIKSALRESGTATSFDPVGISSEIDSAREFDRDSIMSKDADAPRFPEQSSDRITFENKQGMPHGNPSVNYSEFPIKEIKQKTIEGHKVAKFPAPMSADRFNPKDRKYSPFDQSESRVVTRQPVINPFSKMKSGLVQWDKYKRPDLEVAPGEKLTQRDWEVDMPVDKEGGENFSAHTDEFMDTQQDALRDEIAKPGKKGELPSTAIARRPWLNPKLKVGDTKKTTSTTTVTDALYGDSQSIEVDHATGETYKTSSATSPHDVGDAIPAYKHGDPVTIGKKKRKESGVRKQQRRLENLKTDTSHIEIKQNKKTGKEYFVLKKNAGYENLSIQQEFDKQAANERFLKQGTRAEQIERNYVRFRNKSIKDLNKKQIDTEIKHPKVDQWGRPVTGDKEHGPMKRTFVLKKPNTAAKTVKKTTGSLIAKAFKVAPKIVLGPALLALTPWVAEQNLKAAEIDDPTTSQRIQENFSVFFGNNRFISGVNKKPGYVQNLAKHDINAMREFGKRRKVIPIKGAGGPDTPYAKLKKSFSGAVMQFNKASGEAHEAMRIRRFK